MACQTQLRDALERVTAAENAASEYEAQLRCVWIRICVYVYVRVMMWRELLLLRMQRLNSRRSWCVCVWICMCVRVYVCVCVYAAIEFEAQLMCVCVFMCIMCSW